MPETFPIHYHNPFYTSYAMQNDQNACGVLTNLQGDGSKGEDGDGAEASTHLGGSAGEGWCWWGDGSAVGGWGWSWDILLIVLSWWWGGLSWWWDLLVILSWWWDLLIVLSWWWGGGLSWWWDLLVTTLGWWWDTDAELARDAEGLGEVVTSAGTDNAGGGLGADGSVVLWGAGAGDVIDVAVGLRSDGINDTWASTLWEVLTGGLGRGDGSEGRGEDNGVLHFDGCVVVIISNDKRMSETVKDSGW